MANPKLSAKERKLFGRKVKQLRRQGLIPANVFGPKTKSKAITLDSSAFVEIFKSVGETGLVDLTLENEKSVRPVLISNIHQNPVTGDVLHADLHQVDLNVKTSAEVPVEMVGVAPAVEAGGVLVLLRNYIDVEALPADLPDKIEVDVTGLNEIGDSILAKDLKIDKTKITLEIGEDEPIASIQEPAPEEEPEPAEEPEEGEGEEAEKPEEGEGEKAEGDSKSEEASDAKPKDKSE